MAKQDTPKPDSPSRPAAGKAADEKDAPRATPKLDFAKLDLTVEKVEERISPSETNVFDK